MAIFALPAKRPFMHFVLVVATDARHRQNRFAGHRLAMTAIAIQTFMSAFQPETGAGGVIEIPQAPAARVVAAFALRPQTALVHVILFMTCQAFCFDVLELGRGVAFLAFHGHVLAQQRKVGAAMIEGGLFPVLRAMALLAFFALLAFVHVVLLVTGNTGDRRIFVFAVLVAILAFHIAVLAQQAKVRFAVVEAVFLPVTFAMAVAARIAQ